MAVKILFFISISPWLVKSWSVSNYMSDIYELGKQKLDNAHGSAVFYRTVYASIQELIDSFTGTIPNSSETFINQKVMGLVTALFVLPEEKVESKSTYYKIKAKFFRLLGYSDSYNFFYGFFTGIAGKSFRKTQCYVSTMSNIKTFVTRIEAVLKSWREKKNIVEELMTSYSFLTDVSNRINDESCMFIELLSEITGTCYFWKLPIITTRIVYNHSYIQTKILTIMSESRAEISDYYKIGENLGGLISIVFHYKIK